MIKYQWYNLYLKISFKLDELMEHNFALYIFLCLQCFSDQIPLNILTLRDSLVIIDTGDGYFVLDFDDFVFIS